MASATAGASVAERQAATVYSVPYSDDLFQVVSGKATKLTWNQWAGLGYPKPTPGPTDYVRYPWSSQVFAVHFWSTPRDNWGWHEVIKWSTSDELFATFDVRTDVLHKLTPAEWAAMSYQAPEALYTDFYKLPWLDTLFMVGEAGTGGNAVTFDEWKQLGFPSPRVITSLGDGEQWNMAANGVDIIYRFDKFGYWKVVTPEEWARAGNPAPTMDLG
ncbi:hypothetical protein JT358_09785 [Micrococcales bacterium 31B]|nr:hypothetical protein [Micrococcales bacterium 31B]